MEEKQEYITDAVEMLGMGYEHPSIEIDLGHSVMERRNGRMELVDRPSFVKISTSFKGEMKGIDPIALKVWLYIALSVNRNTGKAYPGLRKIAEDCDLAINTIRSAIERLESIGLLTVDRQSKRWNIYEPTEYVSANRAEPTVSANDTPAEAVSDDAETVSTEGETVSTDGKTVSPRMILNQKNQRNQKKPEQKRGDFVDAMIELSQMPGMKKANVKMAIESIIKVRFGVNPSGKDWEEFITYAADRQMKDKQDMTAFADWALSNGYDFRFWTARKLKEYWPRAFSHVAIESPEPAGVLW